MTTTQIKALLRCCLLRAYSWIAHEKLGPRWDDGRYRLVLAQTPLHGALFECCSVLYSSHLSRNFSYTKNVLFLR